MRRYTVVWLQRAQDQLAQIWLEAQNRQAVTAATATIDTLLARQATMEGDEIAEGLRALEAPPLRVLFSVREPDRLVEVAAVQLLVKPPTPPERE